MRKIRFGKAVGMSALGAVLLCAGAIAATPERLQRLNAAETELTVDQGRNMHQLAQLLSVLQLLQRDPPPALLVSPQDARDAVRAAILVRAMTPQLQGRALAYAAGATEMMRQRRLAAVQSEALFEQDSLVADSLPEPQAQSAFDDRAPADALLRPPATLSPPAPGRVVRAFGDSLAGGGVSNGMTFAVAKRARAVSPADGRVQYVGPVKGWGVIVILRLAGGYHLVLAGLDRTSAQVGQSVAAGQAVGWASDGRQSAPELYLEVREQGTPLDPARWLRRSAG